MGWWETAIATLVVGCTSSPQVHGLAAGGSEDQVAGSAGQGAASQRQVAGSAGWVAGGVGSVSGGAELGGGGGADAGRGAYRGGVSGEAGAPAGARSPSAGAGGLAGFAAAGAVAGASGSYPAQCGNGVVEVGEKCEGSDPGPETCAGLGFGAGTLGCTNCQYDTSLCGDIAWGAFCGDGVPGTHACDGEGAPCNELQFSVGLTNLSGTASCTEDCTWAFEECEGWPGPDFCSVAGYYHNGYCDECQLYGGTLDPDCVDACGPPMGAGGAGGVGEPGGAAGTGTVLVSDGFCTDRLVGQKTNCELAGFARDPDCGECGDGVLTFNGYVATEFCEDTPSGPIFIGNAATCADWGYAGGVLSCAANCTPNFTNCY